VIEHGEAHIAPNAPALLSFPQITKDQKEKSMTNVYVEPRPKGRAEGTHIEDYVVEDHADHVLAAFKTQKEAIDWAQKEGHTPHVARVRHLNDKNKADHWRKV
jgi:hypothetical protein